MKTTLTLLFAFLLPAICHSETVSIEDFGVHLFLEKSGRLSKDVTKMEDFWSWNFRPVTEQISNAETFHDFLVKVTLKSDEGDIFKEGEVVTLVIKRRDDNKTLITRTLKDIYIGSDKTLYKGIWIADHECEALIISATVADKTITKELKFGCGE